jgi:hypothetical protein
MLPFLGTCKAEVLHDVTSLAVDLAAKLTEFADGVASWPEYQKETGLVRCFGPSAHVFDALGRQL